MKKILISGYLGYGNFGDEALLYVLARDLQNLGIRNDFITAISANSFLTRNNFNINAINRWNFFEVLGAIIDTDAIVFLGGLFQDKTSFLSFFYYYIQLFLCMLFKKEVVFYAAGIGPLKKSISKKLLSSALKTLDLVSVRDESSCKAVGLALNITCDLAWTMDTDISFQDSITTIDWKQPIIGVSLRSDKYLRRHHIVNLAEKLVKILSTTQEWQIILLPCMFDDMLLLNELEMQITKRMNIQGRLTNFRDFINLPVYQQAGMLASVDVMIGMRYHSLLIPIAYGKPVFGIVYDEKVKSLIDFSNQVGISLKDDLEKPWNYFWQNLERSTVLAKEASEKAKALSKKNLELLEVLVSR